MELDVIAVQIVPEKKGLFLKHSEYEITSKTHRTTTYRRYNDFVHLHSLLITRSPYRLIPRLPPKQLMVDSLLEERRRGLQRWLRIIAKHPVLRADVLFLTFLTDSGADHHDRLRQAAVRQPDEFAMLNENVTLPLEDQGRLAESRETMRTMLGAVAKLKRLADQQAARAHAQSKDVAEMSAVMRLAGSTATNDSNSNADSNGGGGGSGGVFAEMASGFAEVAELSERCALHQHNSISERFNWLTDILVSHSDLCDRVERGIVSDHQKAMSKMLTLNKQRMKGVIQGTAAESVAALHEKEVVQTGVVGTLGRRSAFSLHCVLQETALVQEALKALPSIMLAFTYEQNQGHSMISRVWESIIAREADKMN